MLATTGCDDASSASCARARELGDALRAQLHEPLMCTCTALLDADQPRSCLTLADIPALTGDHAASPLLTRWRWLDPTQPYGPQGGLGAAIPGVVAMLNTSHRSPETEAVHVPDRAGFLRYIRGFAPALWPVQAGPSDLALEAFDSNYVALAERGHPHFRPRLAAPSARMTLRDGRSVYLAALRFLTHYPQYDPAKLRSKPDNNAFAWYADQHLGALTMARAASRADPSDRPLLLAAAMFLELNSWHYLEDSVASGHMIGDANSPHGALNNGALTATHNEYCAGNKGDEPRRVDVVVPQGLCDLISEHGWRARLPQLAAVCASPSSRVQSIYGDHAIAESAVLSCDGLLIPKDTQSKSFDAVLTENWAAALAAESYTEVVRASLGDDFGGVLHAQDSLGGCGHCENRTNDPAYTWSYAPDEVGLNECLFAWWEGDEENRHGNAISALLPGPAFRALSLVPVPEPEGDRSRYPQETFYSGNSVSFAAIEYGYTRSLSAVQGVERGAVDLQYLIVAPRTLLPIEIAIGGLFETAFESPPRQRLALNLTGRIDWGTFSKWYSGVEGQLGFVLGADRVAGGGDFIPIGVTWWDRNSFMSNLELRAGLDGYFGWRAGGAASLAF